MWVSDFFIQRTNKGTDFSETGNPLYLSGPKDMRSIAFSLIHKAKAATDVTAFALYKREGEG